MTATIRKRNNLTPNGFPRDLTQWINKSSLAAFAIQSVNGLFGANQEFKHADYVAAPYNPRMMLTLIAYAYASGVYSSENIESKTETDTMIRYLCARTLPAARDIRNFRRDHKDELRHVMTALFNKVWNARYLIDISDRKFNNEARAWLDNVRLSRFSHEADERINKAVQIDTFILDE
ncbi:MAG: transposase [Verrucomicrobia bacterium]|nr:transposase [Verrucomicrobiota bacterium]